MPKARDTSLGNWECHQWSLRQPPWKAFGKCQDCAKSFVFCMCLAVLPGTGRVQEGWGDMTAVDFEASPRANLSHRWV
jgi:hypothetical protein